MKALIFLTVILLFLAGGIYLQIILSKSANKWLGLIIPLTCFSLSLITVFARIMFTATSLVYSTDGAANVVKESLHTTSNGGLVVASIFTFILFNLPTVISLAIYYYCREKIKENNELKKMSIQDLE